MLYCKNENGNIFPPEPLPINYANISNFYIMDESIVNAYGFYRYNPSAKPEYNEFTHKIIETLVFENNQVHSVYTLEVLDETELTNKLNTVKFSFIPIVENYLDSVVQTKDYKNILHACSYVNSSVQQYKNEALAVITWRDNVWMTAYSIQNSILAGQRTVPTEQQFISELPVLEWPE